MSKQDNTETNLNTPEWREENFLTAPSDRTLAPQEFRTQMVTNAGIPPLSTEDTIKAMNDLCVGNPVPDYPGVDRLYTDPAIPGQQYVLVSFVPSQGATPDSDGIYGMAKVRGVYNTLAEVEQREEFLIRNVDSYHKIQTPYVGRPFPITLDSKYAAEVNEIDIRKKTTQVISQDIRKQKKSDQQEIKEMEDRAEKLREDTGKEIGEGDPMELYTTLVVKKAQLSYTYLENVKKIEEVKEIIIKTRKQIEEMDQESAEYRKEVYDKYMKAREESGLSMEDDSFIKYLVEDAELPF
mgnify:FL=1